MNKDNQISIQANRDYLIKQSEMLQSIISRMADNSLKIKQLGLTLWTALMGFGFTNKNPSLFVLALISFTLLGLLDMYYLYLERRFRQNFHHLTELLCGFDTEVLESTQSFKGNFIKLEKLSNRKNFTMYSKAFQSWANLPYLVVIATTIIIWIVS